MVNFKKREKAATEKQVEEFKNKLMRNAIFNHLQVSIIGDLFAEYDISYDDAIKLADINEAKLQLCTQYKDVDPSTIINSEYNHTQLQIIKQFPDIDLEWIKKNLPPTVPFKNMEWILMGVSKGYKYFNDHNVKLFAKDFDHEQVYEIYAACESGVDVLEFADSDIPAKVMRVIRFALEQGLDVGMGNDSFNIRW